MVLDKNKDKTEFKKLPEIAKANPIDLCVEPTSRCNTKCAHCIHFYHDFGEDMSSEVFAKIEKSLFKTAKTIDLVGAGEPFIAKNFHLFFDECLKNKLKISTTSNGIVFKSNRELVSKVVRNDVTLRFSIDGVSKETFEFVRPYQKWENVIKALDLIKETADEAGDEAKFRLFINFVIMKKNVHEIPAMIHLAAKYNVKEIQFLPLGDEDNLEKMKGQSIQGSPEKLIKPLLEGISLAKKHMIRLVIPKYFNDVLADYYSKKTSVERLFRKGSRLYSKIAGQPLASYLHLFDTIKYHYKKMSDKGIKPRVGTQLCWQPWKSTMIVSSGHVYPCCQMFMSLGNLNEQEWEEIWNGEPYRKLRRMIHGWNPPWMCRYCHVPCGINGGNENHYRMYFEKYRGESLPLTSDLLEYQSGFYQIEYAPDGKPSHVWMGKSGKIKIKAKPSAKFVRFRIVPNTPNGRTHSGYASVNEGEKDYFDNSCDEINFKIDDIIDGYINVIFEMDQTYKAGEDPRDLSIAVSGIEILY